MKQVYEKVLNVSNHKEKANKKHYEISPVRMAIIKKTKDNKC